MREEKKGGCCTGHHCTVTNWHKTIIFGSEIQGGVIWPFLLRVITVRCWLGLELILKPWLGWMSWIAQEHGCYWRCTLTGRSVGLSTIVSTCDLSSMVVSRYPDSLRDSLPSPRMRVPLDSVETEWPCWHGLLTYKVSFLLDSVGCRGFTEVSPDLKEEDIHSSSIKDC